MNLGRGGLRIFTANWASAGLQLVAGVIAARVLGADGKGALVILTTTVALLAAFGQARLPVAGIYYLRSGVYSERTLLSHYGRRVRRHWRAPLARSWPASSSLASSWAGRG